ncbi:MAG: endonuclease/exonuclease/phosphatase family protein [Maribacter sp.]
MHLLALIIGYFSLGSFIYLSSNRLSKDTPSISFLSYNAHGFYGNEKPDLTSTTKKIMSFIKERDPDIICFQEFNWRHKNQKDLVKYPFRYVEGGHLDEEGKVFQAIYSKYPIINQEILNFPQSLNQGIYVDLKVNKDTLRIYNLHLESLKLRPGMIKRERSDRLFKRLRNSFAKQYEQALIFRKNADECHYAKIVCGDFNNTQFSSSYRLIKGDMNDSFAEKGSGYGKTINFWRFPLRIDFILTDPKFEVLSHENYNLGLSDHEPIMASFKLNSNK